MLVILGIVCAVYTWRIYVAVRRGFVAEIESFIDLILIAIAVILGIFLIDNALKKELISVLVAGILLITILLIKKIIHFIFGTVLVIAHLPVIKTIDKLVGMALGITEGTVIAWVVLYAVIFWRISAGDVAFVDEIYANHFLRLLCDYNMLGEIVNRITKLFYEMFILYRGQKV